MKCVEVITMVVIYVLLLIGAVVCFALATFGVRVGNAQREVNLVAAGLLLATLVPLIQMLHRL